MFFDPMYLVKSRLAKYSQVISAHQSSFQEKNNEQEEPCV